MSKSKRGHHFTDLNEEDFELMKEVEHTERAVSFDGSSHHILHRHPPGVGLL